MAVAAAPCEERDGLVRTGGRPYRRARPASGGRLFRCVLYYLPAARSDLPRTTLPGRTS